MEINLGNKFEYFVRKLWEVTGCPQIIKDTISAALAVKSADKVSDDRIRKRIELCGSCEHVSVAGESDLACSICNCKVTEKHLILNLALYEEDTNTPKLWGCKFPGPTSKWQQHGV